jgi:hypothetical protein
MLSAAAFMAIVSQFPGVRNWWDGPIYRLDVSSQNLAIGQTAIFTVSPVYRDETKAPVEALTCDWHVTPRPRVYRPSHNCTLSIADLPGDFASRNPQPLVLHVMAHGLGRENDKTSNPVTVILYPLAPPTVDAKPDIAFGAHMTIGYHLERDAGLPPPTCTWHPVLGVFDNANRCRPTLIAPPNAGAYPSGAIPIYVDMTVQERAPARGEAPVLLSIESLPFTIRLRPADTSAPPPVAARPRIEPPASAMVVAPPTPAVVARAAPRPNSSTSTDAGSVRPPAGALLPEAVTRANGLARVAALREAMERMPPSQRLSVDQALHLLGTLPAPDLRRSGLDALLPRLALPIAPADAVRLVDGFVGNGRAKVLLDFEACIARPVMADTRAELLHGVTPLYRDALDVDLRGWADCPLLLGAGSQPMVYYVVADTDLFEKPDGRFSKRLAVLTAGASSVRAVPGPQTDPVWLHVETTNGQTGYVKRRLLIRSNHS